MFKTCGRDRRIASVTAVLRVLLKERKFYVADVAIELIGYEKVSGGEG